MSAFSDYLEENILESTLRGASFSVPSRVYVALFEGDPGDDGEGASELSDANYERQDAAGGDSVSSGWTSPTESGSGHMCENARVIQFPPIEDDSVTVSHFALFDSSSGGNMLYHGAFSSSKTLEVNDVMSIDEGAMQVIIR